MTAMTELQASGALRLLNDETGRETLEIAVASSEVWATAFSPDGKTLAATTGWGTGRAHLDDVATGQETRLHSSGSPSS
jgi:WD40 repeat protein